VLVAVAEVREERLGGVDPAGGEPFDERRISVWVYFPSGRSPRSSQRLIVSTTRSSSGLRSGSVPNSSWIGGFWENRPSQW